MAHVFAVPILWLRWIVSALALAAFVTLHLAADSGGTTKDTEKFAAMAQRYSGKIIYGPVYNVLSPETLLQGAEFKARFDPGDDFWGLPRTDGYDRIAAYCTGCHSLQIVMQQDTDESGWDTFLKWMIAKQGMPAPDPEDYQAMITYLAKHF